MLSILLKEIKEFALKSTKVMLLLVLAFSFSFAAVNITLADFINAKAEQNAAEESYGDKAFYKISFSGEDEIISRLSEDKYKDNIKSAFDSLRACSDFEYNYTAENSMLFYSDTGEDYGTSDFPKYTDECLLGYEEGESDFYKSDDSLSLKAIYASQALTDSRYAKLSNGRDFEDGDFVISDPDNAVLPVILGSAYEGLYKLGDKITNAHPATSRAVTLEVVGFYAEDSYFYDNNNEKTILNRYMVIPSCNADYDGKQDDGSYESLYSDLYGLDKIINARIICRDDDKESVSDEVYKILNDNELYELNLFDETAGMEQYLSSMNDQTVSCLIIAAFITILSVVMFCFQSFYNIRRNRKKYGIYIMSGITTGQIFLLMMSSAVLVFGVSDILLWILYTAFGNSMVFDFGTNDYTLAALITSQVILTLFMGAFGLLKIKRLNLCVTLRENE